MTKDRETIVVDCNSQYGRCEVVNKLKQVLNDIDKLATNAYCLTIGTNIDMANFAKQIMNIARIKE